MASRNLGPKNWLRCYCLVSPVFSVLSSENDASCCVTRCPIKSLQAHQHEEAQPITIVQVEQARFGLHAVPVNEATS